jgi:phage-related protein
MMEVAKEALKTIGKGVVFAFTLPFLFAFAVYKGALKVCEKLVEKVKDGSKVVKESFDKIKTAITTWVSDSLNKAKDFLLEACGRIKNGAKSAVNAIGKAYLAIVAILGQLASDVKDMISDSYNEFVEGAKEFTDDVKAYISEKWDVVSNWCKKASTAFAEGVKNVWDKMKEKVTSAIGAVKDAYQTLKDNADATWGEIQDWNDERKQEMFKAQLKYGIDEWGKDTVASWIDTL